MAKVTGAVIVCAVVLALDMAAGILAILAQDARNKVKCDVQGYRLGMAASLLFIAAHLSANISGCCDCNCNCSCACCCYNYSCRPQLKDIRASMSKRMNLTITWVSLAVFLVGGVLLVAGTRWCGFVHGHAVGIGAILCFVHSGIIIGFYMPAIIAGCCQAPQEHP
ncbi:protein VASCULATURE COMPLEXITY AND CONNECTIVITY-like [Miscanthus floridulus]|uniref:protein VASCULATURE COMPLEXITY AND CONNECTIVITY-like n=1 Tax=Miscanthus floridulus TaxID=154761 RepID=UPI0034588C24